MSELELTTDRTQRIKDVLWALTFAGLVAMLLRFVFGLGATTNLDDRVPWGLWKIFNMISGAALATCGFTVGFLGHVLHLKPFDRMVKPAILVAFLGYGASLFALLFDIGLPWRFWHPFVHWNIHSFLFEVFWCVSCYFVITFLELSPTLLERLGLAKLRGVLSKAAGVFVIIGITLSSLHHTSLGSLFLVTPQRLHALWYSPIISLLFIISAIGGGLMLLALIKTLHSWWYDPSRVFGGTMVREGVVCKTCGGDSENGATPEGPDLHVVRALVTAGAWVLSVYLLLKIGDLVLRPEARAALLAGTWESVLYVVELLSAAILPVLLVLIKPVRRSPYALAVTAGLAAFGLALNRVDVGIFGYFRDAGELYFPSAIEWVITFGVLAMAGLAFFFIIENFSVFDDRWKRLADSELKFSSSFDRLTWVWNHRLMTGLERASLIALIVLPLAWITLYPPFLESTPPDTRAPLAVDAARDTLRIDANRDGLDAVFAHTAHKQRLGGEESCVNCHHLSMPADRATPCSECHRAMEAETVIFNHEQHLAWVAEDKELGGWIPENQSCVECHSGQARSAASAKACMECHREDMHAVDPANGRLAQFAATSYHSAMHNTCIPCHTENALTQNRPELDRCTTCHQFGVPEGLEENLQMRELVEVRIRRQ
ncbi:polysulfide reductase NrfD [bacterium]|nr:polysulfide reductase NrfD [bacterium]